MLSANLSAIFYLISGVLFILALRGLSSPETKYKIAERFADINYLSFFFFLYIASILWVTKNPPKILTAARTIAKNPKILDEEKITPSPPDKAAIIAPTIITDEIALVTDIKGVCNEGVTLHTT